MVEKNENYYRNLITELIDSLSDTFFTKNLPYSAVRLVFLKYAIDNFIGTDSKNDMQICASAQKMLSLRDVDTGIDFVIPVLKYIDKAYGFEDILANQENIDEYSRDLFGEGKSHIKRNATKDDFRDTRSILAGLDLEEEDDAPHKNGQALVEALVSAIENGSNRNSFAGEYSSRSSLSQLASKILDIQPGDVFCDFASGVGLSTLAINQKMTPQIICADSNRTAVAISAMLYIMAGFENIKVICADTLKNVVPEVHGNKIFVDVPFAGKVERTEENEYTDTNLATLNRIIHNYLDDSAESIAVITVPGKTLFQANNQSKKIRKEILSTNMLKAVIALPPLWKGTTLSTNMLILSKNNTKNPIFINATDKGTKKDGDVILNADIIEQISDVVINAKSIQGFSYTATSSEVEDNDYNFVPANYVMNDDEDIDTTTLAEIDAQLDELYRQLYK